MHNSCICKQIYFSRRLGETNCRFVGVTNMLDIEKARVEIEDRNRVREEAQLPLISVAAELRKLYQLHRKNEFEEFFQTSPIRKRVEEKLLKDCGAHR